MKKIIGFGAGLILLTALALTGCGPSEQEQKRIDEKIANFKVARIAFREVAYIDTISLGDTVIRNFIVDNTGWKPVRIKHAIPNRPECTCRVPDHEIPINEHDTVQLRCIFTDREPKVSVEIIVEHDTPQSFPTLVYIGFIRKE